MNAPGQERSVGAHLVLESLALGTCLGRKWSFVSSARGRKTCLLTLTPVSNNSVLPFSRYVYMYKEDENIVIQCHLHCFS